MTEQRQFAEGQRVRGRNGEIAVIRNGVPVVENAALPSIPIGGPNPRLGQQLQQGEIDIRRGEQVIGNDATLTPLQRRQLQLQNEALEGTAARSGRTPQQRDALIGRWNGIGLFERQLDDLERQYRERFENSGGILGMGEDRNITGLIPNRMNAQNEQFNAAADSLIGTIANVQGTTGGEMNSLAELRARFGPMIPSSADSDATIQQKIATLRQMAGSQRTELRQLLGPDVPGASASPPSGNPFTPEQQQLYDAFMAANPNVTAEQLQAFAREAGLGMIVNAEEVVPAGREGRVAPASSALFGGSAPFDGTPPGQVDDASLLAQGLSGVNEGIASTLGAPVDLTASALNLIPAGIDAVAGTDLPRFEHSLLGGEWWRDRLTDAGSIAPERDSPFLRRVGQSVGASVVPVAGTAATLGRAGLGFITAAGGGAGAAAAREIAPDNPLVEIAGELIGSGGTGAGLFGMARRRATQAAQAAVPTTDQLRTQASNLYNQAESRGVVAGPNVTTNLAGRVRQIAQDEVAITPGSGRPLPGYDSVNSSVTLVDDFAGRDMSAREIDRVRRAIAGNVQKSSDSNERRINNLILRAFDEETTPLAPEFTEARRTASRYLQADEIDLARRNSETRATQFSRSGEDNALRTDFRALERGINQGDRHFAPPVEDAIRRVVRGGPGRSVARWIGGLSPSTTGGNLIPGLALGGAGGVAAGDPVIGALIGGGSMAAGMTGRHVAGNLAQRDAEIAHLLARAGGEIPAAQVVDDALARMIALQLAGQSLNAGGAG